jgi:6-phosphogluconate dehydrogenase
MRRARELEEKGIHFLDVGVSGGPRVARNGACIMVGGRKEIFKRFKSLFRDLSVRGGYGYMGKPGAGHFVKMVHNGIEYGMMQALAEGFAVMKDSPFDLDLNKVAEIYNHRSVIESRLVDWLKKAFEQYGEDLNEISGSVSHSGEGVWTVEAAKEFGIPIPIIEGALNFRIESQNNPTYTGKILSALRNQFGGHEVFKK